MGGGGSTPSPPGSYLQSKETWRTGCNPQNFPVSARHTASGPTKATTANGPTNREWNFLVPARGKFLLKSRTWSLYCILDVPMVPINLHLLPSLSKAKLLVNSLNKLLLLLGKGISCWHPTHTPQQHIYWQPQILPTYQLCSANSSAVLYHRV